MSARILQGSTARLSASAQANLDRLVRTRGIIGAARDLGFQTDTTVNQLMHGGFARPETVRRMTAALNRVMATEVA